MMQKRWLGRFLVLFLNVTVTVVIALSNVAVQRAFAAPKTDPANTVTKGSAVAIVYYRCLLQAGRCTPWHGRYFVHNGRAYMSFPNPTDNRVLVLHAPDWSKVDLLHICGAARAAENTTPSQTNPCHGDAIEGDKWRPWVWKAIHPYRGTPIAFKINGEVHNGAFVWFQPTGASRITKLPAGSGVVINEKGHLKYRHYATKEGKIGGREANSAGAFKPRSVTEPLTASPATIQVKRLPSEPTS